MGDDERSLSIEELAAQADVPVRTVRFYVAGGLLPGPGARGKAAAYGEEHLLRLLLVRRLSEQRVPLAEIRERMAGLTLADVRALLAQEERQTAQLQQADAAESPAEYLSALLRRARSAREQPYTNALLSLKRSVPPPPQAAPQLSRTVGEEPPRVLEPLAEEVWQRWQLAPGVELHVRADALRQYGGIIARLRQTAAALFGSKGP